MKKLSAVLVNLQNPREKVWGILLSIQSSGVTVRGIDLNSFEDWSRAVARGEREMSLSTVFFPIHRVERIDRDESAGSIRSLADTFEERVGQDVWSYLGLKPGLLAGEAKSGGGGRDASEWMTLEEAERDYIERVLQDCEWDRDEAAKILGIGRRRLDKKLAGLGLFESS